MTNQFKTDIERGLNASPRFLPSKYFYDAIGDSLFVEIMNMPEYYLTRSELEIFKQKSEELIQTFNVSKEEPFELVELGAGDGTKTKELLKVLSNQEYDFDYLPIDISQNALEQLEETLFEELPEVNVTTLRGDYFEVLYGLKGNSKKKIVLFLGSNMGNLSDELSAKFLYHLGAHLNKGDVLVLGVDLIKPAEIIMPAYNDAQGITARFNLNLLTRINNELEADFDLSKFEHCPEYCEEEGIAKSYLLVKENQTVEVKALAAKFHFKSGEKIHTEISRKYNDKIIENILEQTDFRKVKKITDSKHYFADYILVKK